MIRSTFFTTILISLFTPLVFSQANYQAGLAKTVITPEESLWMSGYAAREKPAQSTFQDLYAKALVVQSPNGTRAAFITTDLIGVTKEMTQAVREGIVEKTDIEADHVCLTASHTHCGPMIDGNLGIMYDLDDESKDKINHYSGSLINKLIDLVVEAESNLQTVTLSRGSGYASFGKNRRIYTPNGMQFGVNPIGPVDHDVPVMAVKNEANQVIGILFGYACHNTTLDISHYCGDYAGYAQEYLEEIYPHATALFFSGCAGDINPQPRRELTDAKAHGNELSGAVHSVLTNPMTPIKDDLVIATSTIDLPLSEAPSKEEIQEQLHDNNIYIQRRAQKLMKQLEEEGSLPTTYPYPIQVWQMDDFKMIALGGEVVVDYALRLKYELGQDNTWVIAYANDVMGYIPSLRVLQEGGYEAIYSMIYYGFHGPWAPSVEEDIVREVHRLVDEAK